MKLTKVTTKATPQNLKSLSVLMVLSFIFLFGLPTNVSAHDVISESWLIINDKDLLTYNKSLSNSQLFVAERTLNTTLEIGKQHDFAVNIKAFAEEFEIDQERIKGVWTVDGRELGAGRALTLDFDKPGTHEVSVSVIDITSQKEIFSDTLVFTVGDEVPQPTIQLEKRTFGPKDLAAKILLPTDSASTLKIVDPNPDFEYQWDIGGTGEVVTDTQITIDPDQRIPEYILVRTTNPAGESSYSDFYLIVENGEKAEVPRPAANLDTINDLSVNDLELNTPMLGLGATAILLAMLGSVVYFKRKV